MIGLDPHSREGGEGFDEGIARTGSQNGVVPIAQQHEQPCIRLGRGIHEVHMIRIDAVPALTSGQQGRHGLPGGPGTTGIGLIDARKNIGGQTMPRRIGIVQTAKNTSPGARPPLGARDGVGGVPSHPRGEGDGAGDRRAHGIQCAFVVA